MKKGNRILNLLSSSVICLGIIMVSAASAQARASERFFEAATPAELDIIRGAAMVSEADLTDIRVMNLNILIVFRIENDANCLNEVCRSYIYQPAVKDKFTGVFLSGRLFQSDHLRTDNLSHPKLAELNFLFMDGRPQARIHFNATDLEFVFVTPVWPLQE